MSLSVSLSAPPLSVGGLSLVGGGHEGEPLSRSGGPDRPSLTRATAQRGSEKNIIYRTVREATDLLTAGGVVFICTFHLQYVNKSSH